MKPRLAHVPLLALAAAVGALGALGAQIVARGVSAPEPRQHDLQSLLPGVPLLGLAVVLVAFVVADARRGR